MKPLANSFLLIILLLSMLMTACSFSKFPYPELLSKVEGQYYLLYVDHEMKELEFMNDPELLKEAVKKLDKIGTGSLEAVQEHYPKLHIEKVPIYIFFDTKGIVFQTNEEAKALEFLGIIDGSSDKVEQ